MFEAEKPFVPSLVALVFSKCRESLRIHGRTTVMLTVAIIVWVHYIVEVITVFEKSTFSVNVSNNPYTNRFIENMFRALLRTEKIDTTVLSYTTTYFLRMVHINVPFTYDVEYSMVRLKTQGLLYVFLTLMFVPSVRKYVYSFMSGYKNPFTTSMMKFVFEILFNKPDAYMHMMSDHGSNIASLVMRLCGYFESESHKQNDETEPVVVDDSMDEEIPVSSNRRYPKRNRTCRTTL
jgi:hypothetical protein